jgi:hypothetical protein
MSEGAVNRILMVLDTFLGQSGDNFAHGRR